MQAVNRREQATLGPPSCFIEEPREKKKKRQKEVNSHPFCDHVASCLGLPWAWVWTTLATLANAILKGLGAPLFKGFVQEKVKKSKKVDPILGQAQPMPLIRSWYNNEVKLGAFLISFCSKPEDFAHFFCNWDASGGRLLFFFFALFFFF
ncbi:hypothetical protein BC940DRAFT_46596 [Gongronella butleri]|nr:hypothetical protein BC940DRAFT_46596 [Gongronella butleri]